MAESFLDYIKVSSLASIKNPDTDYFVRFVMRWYSKTFHTPLHQVDDLPLDHVFQAYYEEMYEKMDEKDLKQEVFKNSMSPEEWAEQLRKEEEEELAFIQAVQSKGKIEDIKVPTGKSELTKVKEDDGFSLSFEDVPI
jgi:hypothetical protein